MDKPSRLDTARLVRLEATKYFTKQGYSCHYEVGLNRWGKLRADILAFNYKRELIVVEVKSSLADFVSDSKYENYLPFSNKFYFAFASTFPLTPEIITSLSKKGIGILQVDFGSNLKLYRSKSTKVIKPAKSREMNGEAKRDILVRLAYRSGKLRTNKRTWMNL